MQLICTQDHSAERPAALPGDQRMISSLEMDVSLRLPQSLTNN